MAERRMFAKCITESDAFLDMPLSTQALYFHLGMIADDDGFVSSPKKITRSINASEDDLKLLLAKRFILGFESGIIVIKHWKMNNYIRTDRYKETTYLEEKQMLELKENGSYTEMTQNGIPNANQMDTQVRLGKVSLDKSKDSIEKEETNQATGNIIKIYEENIGMLTPISAQKLLSYTDDLSEEVIIKAIEIASLRNKRNTSYITGILNSWIAKGIKTLGDIENEKQTSTKVNIEEVWSE
jgi:DnaD/phage-associated family protein